ncbi:MAG: SIS domain-containing protein [Spirochaetes bacterium]|nr:SIS domain-containing protein [Spirochaetota bacterium]
MCGIVSLIYGRENPCLGKESEALLGRLEYRGYDSTGAAFIDEAGNITLHKQVGAPSKVCPVLGIGKLGGQRFIGQVRWATYGSVTDLNSQPHRVHCKIELVGAHNGNISNMDSLKAWLASRGHAIISDNDGEILVHLVEEHFSTNARLSSADLANMRQAYAASGLRDGVSNTILRMIDALRKAEALVEGSFAAAIADPDLPGVFAMKSGSSLYAGVGSDSAGNFIVVSSDLTSVLSKTRTLIPLSEGEGIWFTQDSYLVFNLRGNPGFSRPRLKRSKLSVKDTQLNPKYRHYMEQEILGSPADLDQILMYYFRDEKDDGLSAIFEERKDECKESANALAGLSGRFGADSLKEGLDSVLSAAAWATVVARVDSSGKLPGPQEAYVSDEAEILSELESIAPSRAADLALADLIFVWRKRRVVLRYLSELKSSLLEANNSGGRIYLVASGSSYHACLTAAFFFNGLPRLPVYPCNPGSFRSMYLSCLRNEDFILGISQSGETKDLIDIFQDVKNKNPAIRRASLVNNENSRIPQELSDFYLPILCGPEIAVAATKSFTSQLAILYLVAAGLVLPERDVRLRLITARKLLVDTLGSLAPAIDAIAERLFLRPSMQVLGTSLIGLAKEGALKIREVVLNHTEGYDCVEFKHGPNTILGRNTIFSLKELTAFLDGYRAFAAKEKPAADAGAEEILSAHPGLLEPLFGLYPLIFICPPDDRDARITVSQINTHKIRGAEIVLIAERRQDLALAVESRPMGEAKYWSAFLEIPHTGDPELFVFGATITLQYLAYRMSVKKMECLNRLGVADHGVHPDAPKNVSKSITVD